MDKEILSNSTKNVYRPDVEAFTKLWSSLRTFYEGTNVTKTIARLLHIYQPEDGVHVYAKLLRTLYTMLKNFDPQGFCTLASMVSPPKSVSTATIEKVFYDATGHHRLNVPVLRFNNNSCRSSSVVDYQTNCKQATKKNCSSISSKCDSKPHSTLKCSIDEANLPLKKRKVVLQNERQETVTDVKTNSAKVSSSTKSLKLSTDKSSLVMQDKMQKLNALDSCIESKSEKKLFSNSSQSKKSSKNSNIKKIESSENVLPKNKVITPGRKAAKDTANKQSEPETKSLQTIIPIKNISKMKKIGKLDEVKKFFHFSIFQEMNEQEKKMQRAIRKDIKKMDHVQVDSKNYEYLETKEEPFEIQDKLKESLKNFLKRIQSGISCNVPDFSQEQSIRKKQNYEPSSKKVFKQMDIITDTLSSKQKVWHESFSSNIPISNMNPIKSIELSQSKPVKRKKPEPPTRPRSERVAQRNMLLQNSTEELKMNSDNISKWTKSGKKKIPNRSDNSVDRYSRSYLDIPSTSTVQLKQPALEAVAYKKQYYDRMMNVQQEEIANSWAISSVKNTPRCHPFYVSYFNQQHMMHQQQCMNGYDPYCHNGWRFQSYGQYRIPQPAHSVYCTMNASNHKYSMMSGAYFQTTNNSDRFKNINPSVTEQTIKMNPKNFSTRTDVE